jgi:signal transduction histidine kinase
LSTIALGIEYILTEWSKSTITLTREDVFDTLKDVILSCNIAINTTNDFLLLDKFEEELIQINKRSAKPWTLLRESIRVMNIQALATNIKIVEECDNESSSDAPMAVHVDSTQFGVVIRNFLSNAIKFSKSGSTITVSTQFKSSFTSDSSVSVVETFRSPKNQTNANSFDNLKPKGILRVSVTDQGCGIAKENIHKLFKQFSQISPEILQNGKGSGIGLWLSKKIIELQDGIVGVSSDGDMKGSTFFVEIPCFDIGNNIFSPSNKLNKTNFSYISASPQKIPHIDKKFNILIVDDSMLVCKMVQKILDGITNSSRISTSGKIAEMIIKAEIDFYDIVLLDYNILYTRG